MSKTWCSLLWMHAAVKTTGKHRACCLMALEKMNGYALKPDGSAYNWGTDSILEAHNSPQMRDMRLKMLAGEKVPECVVCYTREENGYKSRRESSNERFHRFTIDDAREKTDATGYTTQKPRFLDLRFGNLCNLKCVMCHSSSSNMWYEDHIKLYGEDDGWVQDNLDFNGKKWVDRGQMDWWKSDSFWEQMEDLKQDLRYLQMVGGEPLLIERHYEFLQQLVDTGDSKNIRLEYDTNLTNLQPRVVELWKNFKRVNVRCSIDDYGERMKYIRYPANYEKVVENLTRVVNEVPNHVIQVAVTWQILGAFGLPELLEDLEQRSLLSQHYIRILNGPEWYNCRILPANTKQEIIELYKSSKHYDKIKHLVSYLENNPEGNPEMMQKFFETVDRLDIIRNLNWRATFPELAESLGE